MQVKEITIPYRVPDVFNLYTLGDEHTGTLYCAEEELREQIQVIKNDPMAYWVGMGDKAEFITPKDPRWDVGAIPDYVSHDNLGIDQANHYCEIVDPIKNKCLGLLEGNHEDAIRIHSHLDVQKYICDKLEVDSLGYTCFLKLKFKRRNSKEVHMFTGYLTHGSGGAITKGAKLNKLQRIMDAFEADFYAVGHMHELITDTKPYMTVNSNNIIVAKSSVGAVTGCWFKTYTQGVRASYGEKRGFPPTAIGCPVFEITPAKGTISVSK